MLTIDEAVARTAAKTDELIETEMAKELALLQEHGATEPEIAVWTIRRTFEWDEWKTKMLVDLRRWLEEFDHAEEPKP